MREIYIFLKIIPLRTEEPVSAFRTWSFTSANANDHTRIEGFTMSRFLPVIFLFIVTACGQATDQPRNANVGGLPDTGISPFLTYHLSGLEDFSPDQLKKITGYEAILAPINCSKDKQVMDFVAPFDINHVSQVRGSGCDYGLSLNLGSLAADKKTLTKVYFTIDPSPADQYEIEQSEYANKNETVLPVRVKVTADGLAAGFGNTPPQPTPTTSPTPPPDEIQGEFVVYRDGKEIKFADVFKQKYFVIDLSAATCSGCMDFAKKHNADETFTSMFKDDCGFAAIIPDSEMKAWRGNFQPGDFMEKNAYGAKVSFKAVAKKYGLTVSVIPTLFIIDQDGKALDVKQGDVPAKVKELCSCATPNNGGGGG